MIDGIELLRSAEVKVEDVRRAACAIDDEIAVVPLDDLEGWLRRMRFHAGYDGLATGREDVPRHSLQLWTDDDILMMWGDGDGWDIRLVRVPLTPERWVAHERARSMR